jgi:hypothetical protein
MADEGEGQAGQWLHGWQGMRMPEGQLGSAAGGAHAQVRALDDAVRALRLDDEPWRLRTVLSRRARR